MTTAARAFGEILRDHAERLGMPERTADKVEAALGETRNQNGIDAANSFARLMLKHGRLTEGAKAVAQRWLAT